MTLENLLSQMGIGTKQLTDRYSGEYGAPVQDQHIYYAYEPSPPSHSHTASSKQHYGGSSLKSNASMSALTLLAFLFFLHILQQCIKEHMTEMSTGPVVVMGASREGYETVSKSDSKMDKTGIKYETDDDKDVTTTTKDGNNPFKINVEPDDDKMMRINAAEHKPKTESNMYGYVYQKDPDRSSFPGFVSAMNDD